MKDVALNVKKTALFKQQGFKDIKNLYVALVI